MGPPPMQGCHLLVTPGVQHAPPDWLLLPRRPLHCSWSPGDSQAAPCLSATATDIITSANKVLASCWGGGGVCLLFMSSAPQDFHHSWRHCTWGPVVTMPDDDVISQGSL